MRNIKATIAQLSENQFDLLTTNNLLMVKGGTSCNVGKSKKSKSKSKKKHKKSKRNHGGGCCYNPCGW